MGNIISSIFAIQHYMNPLHVYCRFMKKGYRHGTSVFCCKAYEITIFFWMRRVLRFVLIVAHVCDRSGRERHPFRLAQAWCRDDVFFRILQTRQGAGPKGHTAKETSDQ